MAIKKLTPQQIIILCQLVINGTVHFVQFETDEEKINLRLLFEALLINETNGIYSLTSLGNAIAQNLGKIDG